MPDELAACDCLGLDQTPGPAARLVGPLCGTGSRRQGTIGTQPGCETPRVSGSRETCMNGKIAYLRERLNTSLWPIPVGVCLLCA